mgnify:CR=1 FL=1
MDFLTGFLKGVAMGAGAIAPGVSGGALAVIFGLYDKITNFIAHINRNFKNIILKKVILTIYKKGSIQKSIPAQATIQLQEAKHILNSFLLLVNHEIQSPIRHGYTFLHLRVPAQVS